MAAKLKIRKNGGLAGLPRLAAGDLTDDPLAEWIAANSAKHRP